MGQGVGVVGSGVASGLYVVPYNLGLMEAGLRSCGIGGALPSDLTLSLTSGVSGVYTPSVWEFCCGVG